MVRFSRKTIIDLAGIGIVIAVLIYLLFALGLYEFFTDRQRLLSLIKHHRAYAVLIFIALQILQVVAAPIPGEVTGFVGGIVFGPFGGIVYSSIGLTIGSWLAFMLSRLMGRPLVESMVSEATIKRYDYVMEHKGLFLAFLMFLIPGFPKDILCYLLGLGHMKQRDFLIVSTLGRLLGTALLTIGGVYLSRERYGALFMIVGFSLITILIVMIYRDRIERWFRLMRSPQRLKSMHEREHLERTSRDPDDRDARPPA